MLYKFLAVTRFLVFMKNEKSIDFGRICYRTKTKGRVHRFAEFAQSSDDSLLSGYLFAVSVFTTTVQELSQATPHGRKRVNATGCKEGFKSETDCIFYAFSNLARKHDDSFISG